MKTKPREFYIDTLEKLINATTVENFDRISLDFIFWLNYTINAIELLKNEDPKGTNGKSNSEIMKSVFIWTDDGKTGVAGLQLKDPSTGEIHKIKVKKRRKNNH